VSVYQLVLENDEDIVREYCSGNTEEAATSLVRKYQKFVYSIALRQLQNYDDADDAAQEVFIKAIKGLPSFRGESSIKTWLYRITTNICKNTLRHRSIIFWKRLDEVDDVLEIPSNEVSPEQKVENTEFEENFMKLLGKLPKKQRETFALRYFDELSYEEMSKMLGTTVGGLKANYYQAVKRLEKLLLKQKN
jgi:RNA polymerase sigma-70 factor, ECF subfamily